MIHRRSLRLLLRRVRRPRLGGDAARQPGITTAAIHPYEEASTALSDRGADISRRFGERLPLFARFP